MSSELRRRGEAFELLSQVNSFRVEHGNPPLALVRELTDLAEKAVADLRRRGTPGDLAKKAARYATGVVINTAVQVGTASEVVEEWDSDPELHENMIEYNLRVTGVACRDGTWVQIFAEEIR